MTAREARPVPAVLLAALLALAGCRAEPDAGPRRVVLVTLDTLRWDVLAGGGSLPASMPRTLAWCAGSALFERHWACTSTTQPTHATFLTGLQPWEHGVTRNGLELAAEHVSVPEVLAERGWQTGAVVASLPVRSRFGFDQGFETFVEEVEQPEGARVPLAHQRADLVTDAALELLDAAEAPRQFFWFHYFDAHDPYGDAGGERGLSATPFLLQVAGGRDAEAGLERARAGYVQDAAFLDAELARLLERLQADAAEVETHVVLVADHGESLGEGGRLGHGTALAPELLRVPCAVRSPDLAPGRRTELSGSLDIGATLLSLAGVDVPWPGGRDLASDAPPPERVHGMRRTYAQPYRAVRLDGSARTIEEPRFFATDGERLWVGDADAVRRHDGGEVDPRRARELREEFADRERALAGEPAASQLDDATREALRGLGYTE